MTDDALPWVGGCRCGAVRYEASGTPKWTSHYHCAGCRRQVSAAYATWISFPEDRTRFTRGALKIYASSPGVARGFCETCGTPVTYSGPDWKNELHFLVATLDDPARATPMLHAFVAEALPCTGFGDGLPRYAKTPRQGPPLE